MKIKMGLWNNFYEYIYELGVIEVIFIFIFINNILSVSIFLSIVSTNKCNDLVRVTR